MLTLDTLSSAAAPSFEQPLEMLQACHDKIRRFCDQLDQLPSYIEQHGVDEAARNTIDGLVRYFDLAGPAHHSDEEDELFPLILERVCPPPPPGWSN
ncbi:hemerythrin domain-containing protein [Chromobacterium haemolyticum]|nr:hemerythrin domain-containing protein [Chromobacterium haemolyticum]